MESSHFEAVEPVNPIAPYLGGKRNLAKSITKAIAAIAHHTYAEPFIGMGGVFLRRTCRARAEVINDINRDSLPCFASCRGIIRSSLIPSSSRLPAGPNSTVWLIRTPTR